MTPITTVRELSKFLGLRSSSIQAVFPAPLHYQYLQQAKNSVLKSHKSYEALVHLDSECLREVQWWKDNLIAWNGKALLQQTTDLVIETDASGKGWGAYCQGVATEGRWLPDETSYHINCLELLAGSLAIMSFTKNKARAQVQLLMDNISAVTYINKMGGTHSPMLSYLAKNLWDWCLTHNILVSAQYIPGVQNVEANQSISGLQRLEIKSSGFSPSLPQVGSPEHRPLCLQTLLPTRSVCELATRPTGSSYRCVHPRLGDLSRVCLPSIHLDRPMPPTNSESTSVTPGVSSTSLASPILVPSPIRPMHRLPCPHTNSGRPPDPGS